MAAPVIADATDAGFLYRQLLRLPLDGTGAIVHARAHPLLSELAGRYEVRCVQYARDQALALQALGVASEQRLQGVFGWCALLAVKSRQRTLADIADAWIHLVEGGCLIVVAANRGGAKSLHKRLQALGDVRHVSGAKCRLMMLRRQGEPDMLATWRAQGARRLVNGLWTEPGLFSWDRLDRGSALLVRHLPRVLRGEGMDLCCGYGVLARAIVRRPHSRCSTVHLVDADARALACARLNVRDMPCQTMLHWLDAACEALPAVDWIVCNPPFHQGLARRTELGQRILAQGLASLRPGGEIWLVANRRLPYERVLRSACQEYACVAQEDGFKVLYGRRARTP